MAAVSCFSSNGITFFRENSRRLCSHAATQWWPDLAGASAMRVRPSSEHSVSATPDDNTFVWQWCWWCMVSCGLVCDVLWCVVAYCGVSCGAIWSALKGNVDAASHHTIIVQYIHHTATRHTTPSQYSTYIAQRHVTPPLPRDLAQLWVRRVHEQLSAERRFGGTVLGLEGVVGCLC